MRMTRRAVMAGAGAATLAGIAPAWQAQALEIGGMTVQTVSDGSMTLPGEFIFGPMPQEALDEVLKAFDQPRDVLTPPCNVTLLRHAERLVLFDVGAGPDFMATTGGLAETLDGLGIAPEAITDVVFTHAHPDHIWGLLDDFDDPMFTGARYFMGKGEFDYWLDPATVDSIDSGRTTFAVGAKRRIEAIEEQIETFADGDEIMPGVMARACFGHTPGHMAFELRDGSNAVMVVGDAIGNHHVAFAKPEWQSGSDQQMDLAAKSRTGLLDQLAAEQMPLVGFHLPQGGIGRVERTGDGGYRFVAMQS